MSTRINHNDLSDLFKARSEKKEIEHDSRMLMAAFLSEVEYHQERKDISRKKLAKKINISGSYLTQVFRSKKPLNFLTLAKIKRALNLRFEVKAFSLDTTPPIVNAPIYRQISYRDLAQQSLSQIGDKIPVSGSNFLTINKNIVAYS